MSLSIGAALPFTLKAQTDSLYIDSTLVVAGRHTSLIKSQFGQPVTVNMEQLKTIPSLMSNADPVHFTRLLPSMQTGSEIDAGIHIQGCENEHNCISLGGVPLYGASHLLGLFSVFNPSHFEKMFYATSAPEMNRLGGQIDLPLPEKQPGSTEAEASLGLMSLQGTLRIPLSRQSTLYLSGRQSFLNLLYGHSLKIDNDLFRYDFGDYNATWLCRPTDKDKVWLNFYHGSDKLSYTADSFQMDMDVAWQNTAGSIHWQHGALSQSLYGTQFSLNVSMVQENLSISLPSGMATFGYRASFDQNGWHLGADIACHEARPQKPEASRGSRTNAQPQETQRAAEATGAAKYTRDFGPWQVEAMLKGHYYLSPEKESLWGLSPHLGVKLNLYRSGSFRFQYGCQRQYLFQTGVTHLGFPCEFWFLAGRYSRPQRSQYASLAYNVDLLHGQLKFSAEAYYKRLYHQVEYKGDILDFLNTAYRLENHILKGNGHNYGINLMLHKQTGKLTGWAGYAFGRSLRSFDSPLYRSVYPSAHERIHEFNAVLVYNIGKWDFGGTFIAASGTPFTAPDAFYLLSNQIVSHYGEHNANRLPPYVRLDISVNCYLKKTDRMEAGINLSVYNAARRKNILYYRLKTLDEAFAYQPLSVNVLSLPSVSCFVKF